MNFISNETQQKLRGGYYTSIDLAMFLTNWIKEIQPKNILEPSCGDGIFFDALEKSKGFTRTNIVGVELDKKEAQKSRERIRQALPNATILSEDFLKWSLGHLRRNEKTFDAIIGNPPFIRYQYLPEIFQKRSEEIFSELNLPFSKHTNAWVPFILASMALLKPGGRLAMVVPAEIIHVAHAQPLRSYLGTECRRLVIIDPQEIWFDDTLQGAVLLLAEKKHSTSDRTEGLGIYPVKAREFINLDPGHVFAAPKSMNGRTIQGKWTYALLNPKTRNLFDEISEYSDVHRFKDIADVDVGIVTGANDFFLVSDETVEEFELSSWAYPMFGRSEHCPGIIYDEKQHQKNKESGKPTNFIWFSDEKAIKTNSVKRYIKYGEELELHTRYKCSSRFPWYSVPSVYASEIGMLKRAHHTPRLILNKIHAFTTDTAYRIRTNIPSKKLVGCFLNSLTALSSELEGRHYGGGVLELTPSEIERLLIPLPDVRVDLNELDKDVRTKPIELVLEKQDNKILKTLGLTNSDQNQLLDSWSRLRNRRQRVDTSEYA